jgi:hypothetical protein
MKAFKYILSTFLVIAVIWSCTDDELNNLDFTNSAVAPTNVEALFTITQDNSGFVSIAPSADGAVQFNIDYGDGSGSPAVVKVGEKANHTYAEGNYSVNIAAKGITGLTTSVTKDLLVSFQAPMFGTEPIIENDAAVSQQVNVTVPDDAQFAMYFDVYFVEDGIETILTGNVGSTVSYVYANPGIVDIKVVLKGGAIATTEFLMADFEVVKILQPIMSAPIPAGRYNSDYYSIYSASYDNIAGVNTNPDWGQAGQGSGFAEFDLNGDKMLNYTNLSYQGITFEDTPIDVSNMEFIHLDVWTTDVTRIETSLISKTNGERPVWTDLTPDEWTSIDIPISAFTDQDGFTVADIFQLKLVGDPWAAGSVFVDNIYFYKSPSEVSDLAGTWVFAPEAGAFAVGPTPDDLGWWANNADDVIARACLFDDEYVLNADGSFQNVLGDSTWLESWQQGVDSEGCGTPIAPHNGSNAATWSNSDTSITVSGLGAYLGLPKVHNTGEDGAPAGNTITYNYVLSEDKNTLELKISGYGGTGGTETWYFKLVRKESPFEGTWKFANEAGAFAVGPTPDDLSWWANNEDDVVTRACLFDDEYVFNADGSFQNVLGDSTWLETWQQGVDSEGCGTPVAPHNGSSVASWSSTGNTVTVSGLGAYLGLPKVHNTGENGAPPSNSITYDYVMSEGGTVMELKVVGYGGTGGTETWYFKLVKQ